jgi:hypothetical protein
MACDLSRYGVLYFWEPAINKILVGYNLYLNKVICVRKVGQLEFVAYFEVEPCSGINNKRFGQFYVQFDKRGRMVSNTLLTWSRSSKCMITSLKNEDLIFDKRSEFEWIQSSDSSTNSDSE